MYPMSQKSQLKLNALTYPVNRNYRGAALQPQDKLHYRMSHPLASRPGYDTNEASQLSVEAIPVSLQPTTSHSWFVSHFVET